MTGGKSGAGRATRVRGPGRITPMILLALGMALIAGLGPASLAGSSRPRSIASRAHSVAYRRVALPLAAQASVSSAVGASDTRYHVHARGTDLRAASGRALRMSFSRSGVAVTAASAQLGLTLRAAGYGRAVPALPAVAPTADRNRVTYARPGISEWYANGPLGLEQGFTISRRPVSAPAGPLTLSLKLSGRLNPALAAGGRAVDFTRAGRVAMVYRGLSAEDARGRPLRSWLVLAGHTLQIRVDARGAAYPVRIDPFLQPGSQLTSTGESGAGQFGFSVAMSSDGNAALVGAPQDSSGAGAAWVFTQSNGTWSAGVELNATNETGASQFGSSVALSADGSTALIGGPGDGGNAGAAWAFTQSNGIWSAGAEVNATNETGASQFGASVALSADGNTALIGGPGDGDNAGAVWAFTQSSGTWSPGAELNATNENGAGQFGSSVALASDGTTALIGGPGDTAVSTDGGPAGAAWVFTDPAGGSWAQQSELTAGNEIGDSRFGTSVTLSGDANTAAIGGPADGGGAGAAWVFAQDSGSWSQASELTVGAGGATDALGSSVALSQDGNTVLVGDPGADSGNGGAWPFTRAGSAWSAGSELSSTDTGTTSFGASVSLTDHATTALVGAPADLSGNGAVSTFADFTSTAPPIVSSPQSGAQLTAASGVFVNGAAPVADSYQWQRCDTTGANCVDIASATGTTYTPTSDDTGHDVTVVETATDANSIHATATAAPVNPSDASYSAAESIAIPPASHFAGNGGGDGWAVALSATQVFNVFHHDSQLQVACHEQADGSNCPWASDPATIADDGGMGFASDGHPGLYLDQSTGKLYVFATRDDGTGGVVCIDTDETPSNPTNPDTTADPFCGFTPLTAPGDAPLSGGPTSQLSSQMHVGTRLYSFNYVPGATAGGSSTGSGTGSENRVLCFDLSTDAACAGQPFPVTVNTASLSGSDGPEIVNSGGDPEPATAAVGHDLMIPMQVDGWTALTCFDTNTLSTCAGSWPLTDWSNDQGNDGAPFPMLNASGAVVGACLPSYDGFHNIADPCFNLDGSPATTPSGMASAIPTTSIWNGSPVTVGPRVYVANTNGAIYCFDYATNAECTGYPLNISNTAAPYTLTLDPQRPTCLWMNSDADDGTNPAQIQDFDAYTGGSCGQGAIRALASQFVVPAPSCTPDNYTSLQILSPDRSTYTDGTVSFEDGDGNPEYLPVSIDGNGVANLSGLGLNTSTGLPQFLITLNGESGSATGIQVKLNWAAPDSAGCQGTNVSINGGPAYSAPPTISGTPDIGQALTADPGAWPPGSTFAYQWYDCTPGPEGSVGAGCSPITGAADSTYQLQTSDADQSVKVAVTATNGGNSSDPVDSTITAPVPGPATTVSVSLAPSTLTADGQSTSLATAMVSDVAGIPVAGDDVAITSSDPTQTVGSVSPGLSPGTYVATVTASTALGDNTITAQDLTPNAQPSGTALLTQNAGPAAIVALALSPSTIVADGQSQSVATATVTDNWGHPIAGENVTILGSDPDQTVTGVAPGLVPGTYVATITSTTTIQTSRITATDTNTSISAEQTLTQAPDAANVSVALSQGSIIADGVSTSLGTATVTDEYGNPAPGDNVTFTSNGGQGIGTVTDNGDGTYTATITSTTTAGLATITARDLTGTLHPSASAALRQVSGPATRATLTLSPASIVADGRSTTLATTTLTDAHGNHVSGAPVTITPGAVSGSTAPAVSPVTAGATAGTYVATITSTGTAGTSAVTATDTAGVDVARTATLTQTPDRAAYVSVSLSRPSITASGTSTSTATATVTDINGNPVSGNDVAFTSDGGQLIGSTTAGTDPGTYVAAITSTTTAGTSTIRAQDRTPSAHPSGTTTLTQVAGPATNAAVSLAPASIPADGTSQATATATVTDANGNPVSGDSVTITPGPVNGGTAPVASPVTPGATAGTYVATITSTRSGGTSSVAAQDTTRSVAATPRTLTQTRSGTGQMTVSLSLPSILADGISTSTVTATVTDGNGNPVSGDQVRFTSTGAQTIGTPVAGVTPGSYVATITSSQTAGQSTITATDASTTAPFSATAALAQISGPANRLALALSPASLIADGRSQSLATATVTDANGNPVSGDAINITADGAQAISSVAAGSAAGTYVATITATRTAGIGHVTAVDTSPTVGAPSDTRTFTQTHDQAAFATVSLSKPSITADGVSTSLATATVTDQNGNPVSGEHLAFASDSGQSIGSVTDNGDGTYSATVTSTKTAGTSLITATDEALAGHPAGQAQLTQTAGAPAHLMLALTPSSIPAGGASTTVATIAVTDANSNPVLGAKVSLTSSGSQRIGSVTSTQALGAYVATIASTDVAGRSTLTARAGSMSTTATLTQVDTSVPTVHIQTPADGGIYLQNEHIGAAYSCADTAGAADIVTCAGPTGSGRRLDTTTVGSHAFAITAVNHAGHTVRTVAHYVVLAATSRQPQMYLGGPLSMSHGHVAVPLGCISASEPCVGTIRLRMALMEVRAGKIRYSYRDVGERAYTLASGTHKRFPVALTPLGMKVFGTGSELPTIVVWTAQHAAKSRTIVIN
jgi:adhesin/invasin